VCCVQELEAMMGLDGTNGAGHQTTDSRWVERMVEKNHCYIQNAEVCA
jgi:ABC-type uncharacterized transport system ATPase subunit